MNRPIAMDPFGARGAQLRGGLVLAALGAHLAAIGALWLQRSEPLPRATLSSIQVDWVAPAKTPLAPSRTQPPVRLARAEPMPARPPRPMAAAAAAPAAAAAAPPVLSATPSPETAPVQVVAAAPSPATSPGTSPVPTPVPSPVPSTTPSSIVPIASSTSAETTLPAPRRVTLTPTDWVRAPVYAYPREALRRREQGVVAVRIQFDALGVPRQVSLLRSSGSAALDAEALAKAHESRARPRLQDGVPFAFLADTEAEFKF